jgi:hypothetical protein
VGFFSEFKKAEESSDVVETVIAYAKQETLEPLRGAGRWVAIGTVASLSVSIGLAFVLVGVLRLISAISGDAFQSGWSFVPYLIVFLLGLMSVMVTLTRVKKRTLWGFMTDDQDQSAEAKFTSADIESKLKNIQNLIQGRLQDEKQTVIGAAVGAGFIALLVAYFAGKRRGRKNSAYVEIRRGWRGFIVSKNPPKPGFFLKLIQKRFRLLAICWAFVARRRAKAKRKDARSIKIRAGDSLTIGVMKRQKEARWEWNC